MRALRLAGRIFAAALILAWWTLGLILLFGWPPPLYLIPAELVGVILAWKASDNDRMWN